MNDQLNQIKQAIRLVMSNLKHSGDQEDEVSVPTEALLTDGYMVMEEALTAVNLLLEGSLNGVHILTVDQSLSSDQYARLKQQCSDQFGEGKFLLLEGGVRYDGTIGSQYNGFYPTRVEVIDWRNNAPDPGRLAPKNVQLSWQDQGTTLKVFLND